MEIFKIFIVGWGLLVMAILFNVIAAWLKFPSWYDFAKERKKYTYLEYAWLFVMYPMLLGLAVLFLSYIVL
jgi:hypothetical protein